MGIQADNDHFNKVISELNGKPSKTSSPWELASWLAFLPAGLWAISVTIGAVALAAGSTLATEKKDNKE